MSLQVIDMEQKGNVVRFYLGDATVDDYVGDDWDDTPYEHNSGRVYDEYIAEYVDFAFPFDAVIVQPCDGVCNSRWSKKDMKDKLVPMLCVISGDDRLALDENYWYWDNDFNIISQAEVSVPIYMGMMEKDLYDALGRVGATEL